LGLRPAIRRAAAFLIGLTFVLASGCGSSSPSVVLQGGSEATGGKALVFTATTDEELAQVKVGSNLGLELRGINLSDTPRATYDRADYVDKTRCAAEPCEWTLAPNTAGTYEFRAFVVDIRNGKSAGGSSEPVEVVWEAPPRPRALMLLVNGKRQPITPLDTGTDEYMDIPVGKLQVEAVWKGDASGTGYEVAITNSQPPVDESCSTGTSCRVPTKVPILDTQEMTFVVKVQTTRGQKLVQGFKVCLKGAV
jgi:hypothetical protein